MVAEGDDPLTSSFELLVAGPTTNEQENGVWSWFSDETEGMVWSVTVEGDLLIVNFGDLRKIISNAGTSCGSEALLGQLNGTAFLSAEVERVTYEIEGSCDTFYNWLQRDCVIHIRP